MDGIGEEGGGIRLSKRFNDDNKPGSSSEVDYKTKAGTAWSHSYLNQKPWHPLSYPNQRRKWIAEQTHAQRSRRAEEVSREYAQEQEFFRQTALISKKEKEKMEMIKAVSFMYVRPPGYNAESAKAAEIADEKKTVDNNNVSDAQSTDVASAAMPPDGGTMTKEKRKSRPKDVYGRALPTEEEFEVLKNAPRLETGVAGRAKPFAVEVRNVKCLRCGNFGHQSGDRDCPLKDVIMPNEESRLKRDDPLTAIMAQMDPTEPLKWELKQKPGMSPPRGGFQPDDPNQQIVAEDIFDEYGGFLSGGNIPDLLTNITYKPKKRKSSKKSKHKKKSSPCGWDSEVRNQDDISSTSDDDERKLKKKKTKRKKKRNNSGSSSDDDAEFDRHQRKRMHKHSYSLEDSDSGRQYRSKERREKHKYSSEDSDSNQEHRGKKSRSKHSSAEDFDSHYRKSKHKYSSEDSDSNQEHRGKKSRSKHSSAEDFDSHYRRSKHKYSSEDSDSNQEHRGKKSRSKHSYAEDFDSHYKKSKRKYSSEDSDSGRHDRKKKSTRKPSTLDDMDTDRHRWSKKSRPRHSDSSDENYRHDRQSKKSRPRHSDSSDENYRHDRQSKNKHSYSSEDTDCGRQERRKKTLQKPCNSDTEDSDTVRHDIRSERYRHLKGEKSRPKHSSSRRYEDSKSDAEHKSKHRRHQ